MSHVFQATVPSNIALLKYWGKSCEQSQWPANSSLSITLSDLCTVTKAQRLDASEHQVTVGDELVNREHPLGSKIFKHLDRLQKLSPDYGPLKIDSHNSFPAGCGIASSASGLGALTLACLAAWHQADNFAALEQHGYSLERLSELARLGSGSACRSLHDGFVEWERTETSESQKVKSVYPASHWQLRDTIVLFSDQIKKVGSTEAHRAAWSSPLFAPRLASLHQRLAGMREAIKNQDISILGPLIEQETLEMHSVIMSAEPSVRYFGLETGEFLAWVRQTRERTGIPFYFTLDAGPNVHLIYEDHFHQEVVKLLEQKCPERPLLSDRIGSGPSLTSYDEERSN